MDFLLYLDEIGVSLTGSVLILVICGFAVYWYIIWCFLKSAVKRGTEEAIQETIGKMGMYTVCRNGVKQGILDAMEEMNAKKDENNMIQFNKKDSGDDHDFLK